MKKTFRFLALSFALICGTLSSWAGARPAGTSGPADGTKVGATVSGGVVTYNVVAWDTDLDAYQVEITGLDYDGLNPAGGTPITELNIKTSFEEKFGENKYKYYVVKIVDTDKTTKQAFWAMTQLKKLVFAADEAVIASDKFKFYVGNYAFYGCTSLEKLDLPDNVSKIGKYAFQNTAIKTFTIPAECEEIGENAFYNAQSLGEVKVSDAGNKVMKKIGPKVFANSSVKTLDLSKASVLEMIADEAFIYDGSVLNNQLATIILPEPVAPATNSNFILFDGTTEGYTKGIGLANLTGLKTIGNLEVSSVTTIANGAFENDDDLTVLNFPKSASIPTTTATSAFLNTPKLKTLTFADGWYGTIGTGIYLSTTGKKVVDKNGETKFETWTLTADDLANELSHLENIEFKGAVDGGTIAEAAFGNNDPKKACTGLKSVKFDGTIYEATTIGVGAFQNCVALATLTFNGFHMSKVSDNILISRNSFAGTAIEEVNFNGFQLNGNNADVKKIQIEENAFAADNLKKVIFGDITWGKAWNATDKDYTAAPASYRNFFVDDYAFVSDLLTEVVFGNITAITTEWDYMNIGYTTGYYPAFASKTWSTALSAGTTRTGVLQKVTFGNITAGTFAIDGNAFASEALTNVVIGDILTPAGVSGSLNIYPGAFGWNTEDAARGSAAQEKSVTIGNVKAVHSTDVTNNTLRVYAGTYAFAGDKLNEVTIGSITDQYTTFQAVAYSFANTTGVGDEFDAMSETVTIGDLDKANVLLNNYAFQGPAKKNSEFTVTIGKFNLGATSTIYANAFVAPATGTASYTLGDIEAVTTVESVAFAGSNDENGKSNTTVNVGAYKTAFDNANTFTNVKDLTAASWDAASYVARIGVPVTLTVTKDVTKYVGGDGSENKIESITIGGNVSANIGEFGKAVRLIEFTANDPEVKEGAIITSAFEAASNEAKDAETISVIYRVATAKKSNNIFAVDAFGPDDTYKNVVLYTDDWSKANTFENVEIVGNPGHIYRMQLSASDVAPGEDIVANCITGANGKYAYGRLYVPAGTGMLYKVDAKYDEATKKNGVNLFYANISGTNIYMNTVRQMNGYYWIDATEVAQTLIVRTSEVGAAAGDAVEVEAEGVTQAEKDEMATEGTVIAKDWFGATWADMNDLKYATQAIPNSELQNNSEFAKKGIYVMANPKKNNLAFALLDQYNTERNMSKGSVYVVTRADQYEARLNVVWPDGDEENAATAIQSVKNVESNDAIYNLQGVRLNKAQKGINIINGKKVIK